MTANIFPKACMQAICTLAEDDQFVRFTGCAVMISSQSFAESNKNIGRIVAWKIDRNSVVLYN